MTEQRGTGGSSMWDGGDYGTLAPRFAPAAQRLADALADGTAVRWVVDDGDTASPDCEDNALAEGVVKGQPFPTGHLAPPVHPTCRCLVVPLAAD